MPDEKSLFQTASLSWSARAPLGGLKAVLSPAGSTRGNLFLRGIHIFGAPPDIFVQGLEEAGFETLKVVVLQRYGGPCAAARVVAGPVHDPDSRCSRATHLYKARLLPKVQSRLSVDSLGNFPVPAQLQLQSPSLQFQNETRSWPDRCSSTS